MRFLRLRNVVTIGGSLVCLLYLVATQPEVGWIRQLPVGGTTAQWLGDVSRFFIGLAAIFLGRKALTDYRAADMEEQHKVANTSPVGAGLALVSQGLTYIALALLAMPLVSKAESYPKAAEQLLPVLRAELASQWPDHPMPHYLGGLLEHESCITLTHPMCWSTTARLRTPREEGCGPMQVTRAWRPDGTLRFDTLADLRRRHASLAEWSWANCYERGDLQMRAAVLFTRELFERFGMAADVHNRFGFADVSYNQGPGRTEADRRACSLTKGCDPTRYWEHVEKTCTASRAALYGRRSPCDISRHHARDVVMARAPRYRQVLAL